MRSIALLSIALAACGGSPTAQRQAPPQAPPPAAQPAQPAPRTLDLASIEPLMPPTLVRPDERVAPLATIAIYHHGGEAPHDGTAEVIGAYRYVDGVDSALVHRFRRAAPDLGRERRGPITIIGERALCTTRIDRAVDVLVTHVDPDTAEEDPRATRATLWFYEPCAVEGPFAAIRGDAPIVWRSLTDVERVPTPPEHAAQVLSPEARGSDAAGPYVSIPLSAPGSSIIVVEEDREYTYVRDGHVLGGVDPAVPFAELRVLGRTLVLVRYVDPEFSYMGTDAIVLEQL